MTCGNSSMATTGLTSKKSSLLQIQGWGLGPAATNCASRLNVDNNHLKLAKYSIGIGDRFAHQAKAQLQACVQALQNGVQVIPVWNKSNREHTIIGSEPLSVRRAADAAVQALHWEEPNFCDDDHITLKHGDIILETC